MLDSVQTAGHGTAKHQELHVSTDGSTWTDISGSYNAFTPSGGDHMIGDTHTARGHAPITGIGKRTAIDATIRVIYTEEEGEAYDLLRGFYENQDPVYVRHRPFGASGWSFIGQGHIVNCPSPTADSTSGDILVVEAAWHGAELALSQATT